MRRICLVGTPGSGKTTVGRALAAALGVPFVELDALNHQPGWTPLPTAQFRDQVAALVAGEAWVLDGNYAAVQDLVWARADTVVWFDLARGLVTARVLRRTLARVLTRRELWNGNRERLRDQLSADPERSVVLWAWTRHASYRERYERELTGPTPAGRPAGEVRVVRLRRPREGRALLAEVSLRSPAGPGSRSPR